MDFGYSFLVLFRVIGWNIFYGTQHWQLLEHLLKHKLEQALDTNGTCVAIFKNNFPSLNIKINEKYIDYDGKVLQIYKNVSPEGQYIRYMMKILFENLTVWGALVKLER